MVFDPTLDVDKYIDLARSKSVSITHIFETGSMLILSVARENFANASVQQRYISVMKEERVTALSMKS